jgi:hypothetical protein
MPQDGLVRQFGLASKLAARLGEASTGLQQAGDLQKQLGERKKDASGNAELLRTLQQLEEKVGAALESDGDAEFGLFGLAAPGKDHEPLRKVVRALTGLLMIVESAESAPAADAAMASERWERVAQETLARWAAFQKDELASANGLLEKAKLKTLVISPSGLEGTPTAH